MKFLTYQRVRYVGRSYPNLPSGANGFISDANNALSVTTRQDETLVEFPNLVPRRQCVRIDRLEAIEQPAINPGSTGDARQLE